ncbi:hypothetical protein IMSAGC014_00942 [Bacteroidaceae bacterium]|nr:hypothetical protein IMSAGC014_00942 [Bacteroidaceae bacterium]
MHRVFGLTPNLTLFSKFMHRVFGLTQLLAVLVLLLMILIPEWIYILDWLHYMLKKTVGDII